MAVDRPTFSENWYRVTELKPKLRAAVQIYRQHFRGQPWHVVRDPSSNQFFRLNDASYFFVALLDGRRTVARAWEIANEKLGDSAPTQGEVIQLLGQLYTSNLLQADLPGDARGLFERYRKRVGREVRGYLSNFLFLRIPLFNPQRILDRWIGAVAWLFGPVGLVLWVALLAVAGWQMAGHWGDLISRANPQEMLKGDNLILLYVSFALIKVIHEFGHGFACKRFGERDGSGGDVHTMGIMLLVLMPVPYVDATSSWAFRSKWRRAFVAAAGMYVELAVAAVAAIVWARTSEGSQVLGLPINALAYNMVFLASITTILFNGNPLLRYDGYYILADLLEIPNLAQRSKQHLYYLVKRYVFGVKKARPVAHTGGERFWLFVYAIASTIYRVFILAAILWFIAEALPVVGVAMAAAAIVVWGFVPLGKFFHYLATHAELQKTRSRAVGVTTGFLVVLIVSIGLIRVPDRSRAEGFVVPCRYTVVHAGEGGFIEKVRPTNIAVAPTDPPLAVIANDELQAELDERRAQRRKLETMRDIYTPHDPATRGKYDQMIAKFQAREDLLRKRVDALVVRSSGSGLWFCPRADELAGAYIPRGAELGLVADLSELEVRVVADQFLGPRLDTEIGTGEDATVRLRLMGRSDVELVGAINRIDPGGHQQLPSPALSYLAGGSVALDPEDPQGGRTAEPFFEVRIRLESDAAEQVLPGQRVVARFDLPKKPLIAQWWRMLRQLVQRRFRVQM